MVFARALISTTRTTALRRFAPKMAMRSMSMKFLETHEYLKMESETEGVVGVTDFAQSELGDVVYVELPSLGTKFAKGDVFGSVESVKAASQVYSPVDGKVIAVNDKLNDDSGLINTSPEVDGWIIRLKLSDPSQTNDLMDQDAYKALCDAEEH